MEGASESEVLFVSATVFSPRRGLHIDFSAVALAKSMAPADDFATFLTALSGHRSGSLADRIRGGVDLFPVGADPETLALCLDGVRLGTCHVHNTAAN
ncbi:unnamed protein product [Gemmata massiliana]|uniref:Uncharacterized protein n=2 Tax=Gemmata massiliana TaxID=1210884 RepID=A0A6P2D3T5_9BACT|nr:unnamed protein product [Gemmata massiliana]